VPLFQSGSSCKPFIENEFDFHENEPVRRNTFSCEWFRTKTRFDTETKANSLLGQVVSFAAVIRVVTQRSSPLTAVSGEERCVTTLITAAKETIGQVANHRLHCKLTRFEEGNTALIATTFDNLQWFQLLA